jgi:hypothetical protein
MTWIGFQVRGKVPTIFVQLSKPVAWSVAESDKQLVYSLVGATITQRNNTRPLDVRNFGAAAERVEARRKGRDVEVVVQLKKKSGHKEHHEQGPGGYKLLVIELDPIAD